MTKLRCQCGWEGDTQELALKKSSGVVVPGEMVETLFDTHCPCCDTSSSECCENVPLCAVCEEVYVDTEGDDCGACVDKELDKALVFDDALGG